MTEETQQNLIGRKVSASSFNELIESISSLSSAISPGCSLITEEYLCKGMIAKYGMLDLTYKIIDAEEFVRIYARCNVNIGYRHARKTNPKINVSDYVNEFVSKLDSFFPLEFVIMDCCITNDLWVWSEKYFYV